MDRKRAFHRVARIIILAIAVAVAVAMIVLLSGCSVPAPPAPASAAAVGTFRVHVLATPQVRVTAQKAPAKYDQHHGPNTTEYVIMTYDDCPRSVKSYKTMVNYASSHDIGLVLFPTGDCIKSYKKRGFDLVGYARDRGIWVANHSKSHPQLTKRSLSKKAVVKQIEGTAVSNYGRPPYGAVNAKVRSAYKSVTSYGRHGMRIFLWDVDTNDWRALKNGKRPSSAVIVKRILADVDPGDSVLAHMQHNGFTPTTLRNLEKGLAKKGMALCRAWHGEDRTGPIEATGRFMPDNIC